MLEASCGKGDAGSLRQAMKSSMDKHAPMRTRTTQSRKREPWYNDDIHNARQLRRIHEIRWRESKLEIHRLICVQHRSEVNTMTSRAKQQYYEHKLTATDQKTCFKVVSEMLDTADTTLPTLTPIKICVMTLQSSFRIKLL